jgi:hypothetical protein
VVLSSTITEDEAMYNEKLLKLALGMSELTAMQAKQQLIEQRLRTATQQSESHAVIEVDFDSTPS